MPAQWALLRALREGRRWSIRALAEQIGTSREHLGQMEAGRIDNPGWQTVRTWAAELGVSLDLIDYLERTPEADDSVAEWAARQVLNGHSDDEIIAALRRRYG